MAARLEIQELRHRLGGRDVVRVDALRVESGERIGVLGANGAGKTTLLRLLAALERPTQGRVEIDGVDTARAGAAARRRAAYTPQRPVLLSMSVRANVELPLRYRRVARAQRRATAMAALARLRVEHLADRPARALSGGEAQRVSLARALACDPGALLLDEPAAGLDGPTRTAFFADLEGALADRSTTVVLVSHQAEEILPLADRVAVVVDGELRQLSAAAELVRAPADAAVARLLGYQNVLDAEVGADGTLLLAGRPTELRAAPGPRPVTLAAWASSVRILPAGDAPLSATVSRVAMGPGRWDVTLRAEVELRAQVPFGAAPPSPGDVVAVAFDAAQVAVIDRR